MKKQQIVTSLQTVVTTGNAALKKMAADKGCIDDLLRIGMFDIGIKSYPQHVKEFGDEFVKYFNVAKNCSNTTNMDCSGASYNASFDGSGSNYSDVNSSNSQYKFITANGMAYGFALNSSCNFNMSYHKTGNMKQYCGDLIVDINGPQKGPNYYGKDIFGFYITNGKGAFLYPFGGSDAFLWGFNATWHRNTSQKTDDLCSPKSDNPAASGRQGTYWRRCG
ncbi:MAG: hypothetical protein MZV64_27325 [Ignavibacteriales bacterium]|nr:hypothetical protein [Ignavibacteriales bacterium]